MQTELGRPELGPIRAVTTTVPDLAAIEAAYTAYLGYRVLQRGSLPAEHAAAWGCPASAGCPTLTLAPEQGEATYLRFVEDPAAGTIPAFTTHGWNATEITVQDTDLLAERLANSPFRIIGPPRNLTGFEWIRAMQVLGPAGECLYLTDVGGDASLAAPSALVGQVFITVVGGAEIAAMARFYREHFSNDVSDPVAIPIGVISDANNLPAGTLHQLGLVTLPGGTRIEIDQYPNVTTPRPCQPGHLPPGMCMVSFQVDTASGYLVGAAGELIELCKSEEDLLF
jgi:hypothetical protein